MISEKDRQMENTQEKETEKKWLNAARAARYLDMNIKTFRNYVSRGVIPVYQNPQTGTRRFFVPDLDQWMGKTC